ncbi:MAG: YlbF family regulator [Clostridia bacterium]|nr:YlbF family regulator [Clostridia bacterium]
MKDVMKKAQELAEAILASDVYRKMKELEETVQADPGAAEKVGILMEKRQRVENLLTSKGMDPEELKRANEEMVRAEAEMNANEKVAALKKARKDFSQMMDNVNRILRLVITGEIREDDISGCSGNCKGCNGCG